MIAYLSLFGVPAALALRKPWPVYEERARFTVGSLVAAVVIALMIGLRFDVGGDWDSYLLYLERVSYYDFIDVLTTRDPGYVLLNWLASQTGLGIYGVNIACGMIFALGTVYFCRQQPLPRLALAIAVPYLVIVVAMGYSRQGAAIGLVMAALSYAGVGSWKRSVLLVVLAATFHLSAIVALPFILLSRSAGRTWVTWLALAGVAVAGYLGSATDETARLSLYLMRGEASQGATIRVLMNFVPAALFIIFRRRIPLRGSYEQDLWTWISLICIAMPAALWLSPSSTVIDRLALYFIPVQIVALSRLPLIFRREWYIAGTAALVAYSGVVLMVWLLYSDNAHAWLPYQMFPFAEGS